MTNYNILLVRISSILITLLSGISRMEFSNSKIQTTFKIAALDLDGTLLNSNHELSSHTINILRKINNKGFKIAIATGRSAKSVVDHIQQLDLACDTPIVCYNGAVAALVPRLNPQSPISYFSMSIPNENASNLLDLASELGLVAQYYNGETGDVYAVPQTEEHIQLLKRYAILTGKEQVILSSYEEAKLICPSAKMLLLTNDIDTLMQAASERIPPNTFQIVRGSPHPFFVEFLPLGVTKGEGLKRLCDELNIPLSEVVAFGDGDNDKEMLEYAGLGIAMKNAGDLAKRAANLVLDMTNDEDGVAKHLELMEQQGLLHFEQ